MLNKPRKQFKHVCPRNCYSNCTMISTVENGRIAELNGNSNHPYTKGKLCAKGFASIEMNDHGERLKFPYYQEVKGSGKFRKITWEKAFQIIISEMVSIHKRHENFLPLGFLKGTGNLGVHHFVTEQFFSSVGRTTKLHNSSSTFESFTALGQDMRSGGDPLTIKEASLIIIWGANPAATNVHLVPFIIEAKVKGAKVVVMDPLYTQSAELADLFIQVRPGADGLLAHLLILSLLEADTVDKEFVDLLDGFAHDIENVRGMDKKNALLEIGVSGEAIALLLKWYKGAGAVAHVIGNGLLRHADMERNICAIKALAAAHSDVRRAGGGVFVRQGAVKIFTNQIASDVSSFKGRTLDLNNPKGRSLPSNTELPLEMLWISCANPLTQAPNPQFWQAAMREIPFVVTVGHFFTPTAKMSNLVLPTTTHFEEFDIIVNDYHKGIAFNEKAVPPYHESRSEWNIMKELALRLDKAIPGVCSFPVHSSEEEYLDAQFNDRVYEIYGVRGLADLKRRIGPLFPASADSALKRFEIVTKGIVENERTCEFVKSGQTSAGKSPTERLPFWLLTPHHPYRLNSQFHFLNLSDEKEACVGINAEAARKLGIFNGEIVRVFNNQDSIEIKAVYSTGVPQDVVFIYEGWYPNCDVNVNRLIPSAGTVTASEGQCVSGALFNTFVNVEKL